MEDKCSYPQEIGYQKWVVKCLKCGYVWVARTESPKRCALCNNLNPSEPRKYKV
jgi:hypothetical protein